MSSPSSTFGSSSQSAGSIPRLEARAPDCFCGGRCSLDLARRAARPPRRSARGTRRRRCPRCDQAGVDSGPAGRRLHVPVEVGQLVRAVGLERALHPQVTGPLSCSTPSRSFSSSLRSALSTCLADALSSSSGRPRTPRLSGLSPPQPATSQRDATAGRAAMRVMRVLYSELEPGARQQLVGEGARGVRSFVSSLFSRIQAANSWRAGGPGSRRACPRAAGTAAG